MPNITEPLPLRCGAVLPNRLAKSATSEGLADARGWPTPDLDRLYGDWAGGDFGLILTGAVMVDRDHLERLGNVILEGSPTEGQLAALRSWTSSARRGGAHFWAQLSHAGRQTVKAVNAHPLSASVMAADLAGDAFGQPDAMMSDEIEWVIEKFAAAAGVCKTAGFTGVQIHAGDGYLISSFLNRGTNQRTDHWGGSWEKRAALLLAIVAAIRTSVGAAFPIGVKLDLADFKDGELACEEGEKIALALEAAGVDLLQISERDGESRATSGASVDDLDRARPSSLKGGTSALELVRSLRRRLKTPVLLAGGLRSLGAMQEALDAGADMVGVARPVCVEPRAVKRLIAGEIDALERWEERLGEDKGFFGSNSPLSLARRLNRPPETHWFYAQLYRLGRGEPVATDLRPLHATLEVAAVEKRLLGERRRLRAAGAASADALRRSPAIPSSPTPASPDSRIGRHLYGGAAMHPWSLFKRSLMGFWYWYVNTLTRLWPSITLEGKRLTIFPGVYKPLENEPACAEYCRDGDRVLDLGSGSGVCSVFCAPKAREVIAVDISAVAVKNTAENCRRFGFANVVAMQSDMFSSVEGKFDLILANAPYIAADFKNEDRQFATSTRYLPTLFSKAREHLTDDGRLLVQFPIWFRGRIDGLAARHGYEVVSVRRLPPKSLGLSLMSLAYLQIGFRSAYFLIRPLPAESRALAA